MSSSIKEGAKCRRIHYKNPWKTPVCIHFTSQVIQHLLEQLNPRVQFSFGLLSYLHQHNPCNAFAYIKHINESQAAVPSCTIEMPRFPVEVLKRRAAAALNLKETSPAKDCPAKVTALRSSSQSSLVSISTASEPETTDPVPDPLELVYNIRHDSLRQAPRSAVLRQDVARTPLIDLPVNCPPLLVDGRMQIVQIPKWKRDVGFFWRSCSGSKTEVHWRRVRLPWKIWTERNFGEGRMWRELWIERS
jgi:hypothetical protein